MHDRSDRIETETTLGELARAIHEVAGSDDEARAVLDAIFSEGRIVVVRGIPRPTFQ